MAHQVPIATGAIHHAALNCREVPRAVAFYTDVLGFHEIPRPGFDFDGAWLDRAGCNVTLHLIHDPRNDPPREQINSRVHHLAFRVADIDATMEVLRRHEVRFIEKPLVDFGYRRVFLHDPDGNVIELGEWP